MTLSDLWPHLKVTTFFEVKYRKNEITLEDKVTIAQYETIPNIWNGSCLVTLTDLQTRRARLSASAELLVVNHCKTMCVKMDDTDWVDEDAERRKDKKKY